MTELGSLFLDCLQASPTILFHVYIIYPSLKLHISFFVFYLSSVDVSLSTYTMCCMIASLVMWSIANCELI